MNEIESKDFARLLSSHLRGVQGASLAAYLHGVYGLDSAYGLSTKVIYAVEVAGANFARGDISSVPVHFWEITADNCRALPFVDMRPFNAANDAGNELWPYPIISFYCDFPLVLSCEGVGPTLKFKRLLSVAREPTSLRIVAEQKSWLLKYHVADQKG